MHSRLNEYRTRILIHILPLVPFDGWTDYALREAARAAGCNPAEVATAFPGGVNDCIDAFMAAADEAPALECSAEKLASLRVPQRIESLILARLRYFSPHREAVRRATAHYALPWNAGRSLRSLYRTVDAIWRLAGDSSTDFSFYTRRMTLAGVYGTTQLFWLNHHSEDCAGTADFLKRRLQNVADFGKWRKGGF